MFVNRPPRDVVFVKVIVIVMVLLRVVVVVVVFVVDVVSPNCDGSPNPSSVLKRLLT